MTARIGCRRARPWHALRGASARREGGEAARSTTLHFNANSPFDLLVFNVMGAAITVSSIAAMLFLWMLRRDRPSPRVGLFIVASALPGLMVVANNAHSIAKLDGGAGRPAVR